MKNLKEFKEEWETMGFQEQVEEILAKRKESLVKVQEQKKTLDELEEMCRKLIELKKTCPDDDFLGKVQDSFDLLEMINNLVDKNRTICNRFGRDTVNVGVAGGARVGKSTLLQKLTGLGDDQIPSGSGEPVTAVGSRIFNEPENHSYASIKFHDKENFMKKRIKPLLDHDGLKEYLDKKNCFASTIVTFDDFKNVNFPENCQESDGISGLTEINAILKKLRDFQKLLPKYEEKLRGELEKINDLSQLRFYVAYPKGDEKTYYPAVEQAKIYCHFPNLDGVKLQLVDLPGFGELGGVDEIQIDGLENEVDHAIHITRPTATSTYISQQYAKITKTLERVQKDVTGDLRQNLFTHLINEVKRENEDLTASMKAQIKENNPSLTDENLCIVDVTDASATSDLFQKILSRMVTNLPKIDEAVLRSALPEQSLTDIDKKLSVLETSSKDSLKSFHRGSVGIWEAAKKMQRDLALALNDAKEEWTRKINTSADGQSSTEQDAGFIDKVHSIKKQVNERLSSELWSDHPDGWLTFAKKEAIHKGNNTTVYSDECHRLQMKIIGEYNALNQWYDQRLEEVKENLVKPIRDVLGNLVDKEKRGSESLKDIVLRLKDTGLDLASLILPLEWLSCVKLDFQQQVLPAIYEKVRMDKLDPNKTPCPHGSNTDEVVKTMKEVLENSAKAVNFDVAEQIQESCYINSYLVCAMEYFDDRLLRADWKKSKTDLMSLLENYDDVISSNDSDKEKARWFGEVQECSRQALNILNKLKHN